MGEAARWLFASANFLQVLFVFWLAAAAGFFTSGGLARAACPALPSPALPPLRRCRTLLPTPAGPLLTAGTDRAIRCWDAARPQQSYVVCTAPPPIPLPHPAQLPAGGAGPGAAAAAGDSAASHISFVDVPRYEYAQRLVGGVPVVEELCTLERSSSLAGAGGAGGEQHPLRVAWAERAAAQCHHQPILDLARVDATSHPVLLSCSHDGVVKAWR